MLNVLAALLLLAASDCRSYDDRGPPIELKDAVVVSVVEASFDSGFWAAWNRIDIKTAGGGAMTLFQPHMTRNDPVPLTVGSICDFTYRMGMLGGSMGPGLDSQHDWPMVERVACR